MAGESVNLKYIKEYKSIIKERKWLKHTKSITFSYYIEYGTSLTALEVFKNVCDCDNKLDCNIYK